MFWRKRKRPVKKDVEPTPREARIIMMGGEKFYVRPMRTRVKIKETKGDE